MTTFKEVWGTMNAGNRITLVAGLALLALGALSMGIGLIETGLPTLAGGIASMALAYGQHAAQKCHKLEEEHAQRLDNHAAMLFELKGMLDAENRALHGRLTALENAEPKSKPKK